MHISFIVLSSSVTCLVYVMSLRRLNDNQVLWRAGSGQGHEGSWVDGFGAEIELCVIGIWVDTKTMLADDLT